MGNGYVAGINRGYASVDEFFNPVGTFNPNMDMSSIYTGATPYTFDQNAIWNQQLSSLQHQQSYNNQATAFYNQTNGLNLQNQNDAAVIRTLIQEGEGEEALEKINELIESLRSQPQYQGLDEETLRTMAIQQAGGLEALTQLIEENCDGSFKSGLLNSVDAFGLFGDHSTSKEELIARLRGTEVPKSAQTMEVAGSVIGGMAIGAAIGTAICPGPGTVIGGAIGAVAGGLKKVFGF